MSASGETEPIEAPAIQSSGPSELEDGSLRQYLIALSTRYAVALNQLDQDEKLKKGELVGQIDAILFCSSSTSAAPLAGGQPIRIPQLDLPTSRQAISLLWADANRAEQLLCFLLTGPMLDAELDNQIREADDKKLRGVTERRDTFRKLIRTTAHAEATLKKQALLFSIVSDVQFAAQKRFQIRQMRRQAVRFVSRVSLAIITLVGMPLFLYIAHRVLAAIAVRPGRETAVSQFVAAFPNFGLFTALSFGALGALFSRFLLLQRPEVDVPRDDARAHYSRTYITLRMVVGTVGAIIVYFFLASGLIDGPLVPDIGQLAYNPADIPEWDPPGMRTFLGTWTVDAMVPSKHMALLIVWAFLAGFSERLVPNILTTTSDRVESQYSRGASTTQASSK